MLAGPKPGTPRSQRTTQEPKDAPASPESKEIPGEKVSEGREEAERSGLQDHDGFICLFVCFW